MKKYFLLIIGFLIAASNSFAQNSLNSGDFVGGSWGSGQSMSASAGGSFIITKAVSSSGDKFFRFYGDGSPCGEYQPNTNGDAFVHSTTVTTPNGNCGNSNAWKINVPTASSNVVFKTDGGNDGIDRSVAFVIQGTPITISTVTRTIPAKDVAVTVTATLSGALPVGQDVYLRYTNNSYSTSTVVKLTGTGTTYTGTLPASLNTAAANVSYYVFTSGTANVAADGSNADLYTINLNNNGGINYTYTVPTTYYSKGSLAPNTAANWNTNRDGTGSNAANFTSGVFVIQGTGGGLSAPHTMISGSSMTFAAGTTLIVEDGATLQQSSTITFNASATFQLNSGSTFNQNATGFAGISAGIENWSSSATVNYINSGFIPTANITGSAHPNVTISATGNRNLAGVITNISGNLIINSGTNTVTLTGATALNLTVGGNIDIQSTGAFSLGNGTASPTLNLGGNLSIVTSGTFTYSGSGTANVNFTKPGTQTLTNGGTMSGLINYNVNSGSTLDVGTNLISGTGTFTVASGAGLITANTAGITSSGATGSIRNTGTRTYSTSANYTFNNNTTAQVAGNGLTGANNLTISNSGGVSLSAAAAVTGTLTFTNGQLDLGANNLTLTGATISGASSSNYIVTSGAGRVLRSIASGGGSFVFPIGRNSITYNPVTITNTGASTSIYTVGAAATTYTTAADGANAQWSIASGTSTTSTFAFTWTTADAGSNLTASPASGKAYSYNGSTWGSTGGTTTGTPNVTTESGITSSNTIWTVAMPPAVPDIALADNSGGQVASGNITRNTTNNIIYNFQLGVTTANTTLNSVAFTTTNNASDVSNFKLYYSTSNSFGSASQIGSTITSGLGTGSKTFSSLSQVINSGTTGYFWITTDVPSGATAGNTVVVSAITTSDITFASGNKTGSTTAGGTQTFIDAPTVTTNAASSIATTSVVFNGNVNANANSTVASFDYSSDMSFGTNTVADQSPVSGTSNTSISKTVTGLNTNTLYNYRAKGVNDAGTTNGSNATLTTLSNAPTVGTGDNATAVGFRANWTAPTNDGSEAITYTVEVDNDNTFASVDATQTSISALNYTFTTLNPGVTYYYRVRAVNAGGNSAWSAVSAGIATTSSTIATVTTAAISSITINSASGGGEVVIDGGDAVTERGIVFNTTGTPTTADTKVTSGTGVGSFTANLTSLSSNTTYYVRAYAINGVGTAYGSEVNFTTLVAEPTTPSTVSFGTRTNASLVVNFNGGNGARRVVFVKQGSAVDYTPTDAVAPSGIDAVFGAGTQFGTGNYAVYDGNGTSVTVTGLTKNTTYHIAVYEYNNNSASLPNYFATAGTDNATTYNPTIAVGSVTAFGNVVTGTNSSSQTYNVSGTELAASISITAPTGFAISLDDVDFSVNPIVLAKNGSDAVPSTPIYIRFSPASANGATGSVNITHASTDATTQNVAVSGNAIASEPSSNGSISFGATTANSIVVDLPSVGNGSNRIIVAKAGSAVDATPADGISYTANATFTSGSQLGTGNYVVYNGTGSGSGVLTVTGLTSGTTYHFAVFEYNDGTGTSHNYFLTGAATGSQAASSASNATDSFRTVSNGNWNSISTWESKTNGNWMAATLSPDSSAAGIAILNGHTVTVSAAANGKLVTVNTTGQITISSGQTLTIGADGTGTSDLNINGYLLNSGTLTLTTNVTGTVGATGTYEHNLGNLTIPTLTWISGSTLNLTGTWAASSAGTTIATLAPSNTYQNVTVNIGNPTADSYISLGSITIGGKLKVMGTGSGAVLAGTSTTLFSCTSYEQTGGTFYANRQASGDRGIAVTGNVDITGGTFYLKVNATSTNNSSVGRLNVGGNLTVSSPAIITNGAIGAQTVSTTAPLIMFTGSSAQQYSRTGTASGAIGLEINNTSGVTLNNAITAGGTINLVAGTLTTNGNLTVASATTITRTAGTFATTPTFAGTVNVTYANTSPITSSNELPSSNVTALSTAGGTSTVTIGSSTNIATLTLSGSNMTIGSGVTVTASSTSSISASKILQINGTYSAGAALTNSGTLNVDNLGRYIHNTGTTTLVTATWNTGSTCEIQNIGSGTVFAFGGQTLHHLIWNNSTQAGSIQLSGSLAGVNGNLEIQNCGNNATRYFRLTNANNYSLSIGGNLNISAVNGFAGIDIGNSSGTNATITVAGSVIIGASGSYVSSPTGNTLRVAGNWSNSGTFTSTNTTVVFNGTIAQSITGTTEFNNLTINKSSDTLTVNSNISVASAGSLNLTAGILNDGGNIISVAGNVTGTSSAQHIGTGKILMNNSSTRTFGGTISIQNIEFGGSGNTSMVASAGSTTAIYGTATFSGSPFAVNSGNTLVFGDTANIIRNNGAGSAINQSSGNINYGTTSGGLVDIFINASCSSSAEYIQTQSPGIVNSVNIADGVTYTIIGSRATTTLNLNNTGILALVPATTLTYTINGSILGSGSISGHINASLTLTNGSNSLNLTSGSRVLNNLNIAANGTLTLQTPAELMGNLTLTSGGVLADNGQTVTLNGNIANTGIHTSTGSGKIALNGTTKTISGATLGNVDIGSGSSYSLSGSPTVNGILTLLANVDLASSSYTLNLANTSIVEAGTSQMIGTGTVNVNGIFKTARADGFTGTNAAVPDATVNLGSSSTVEYTSATAQTFTTRTDYKNVTISGSGEKTLTGNPTIANALTLTGGTLAIGASNVLTISSGGSIAATSGSLATGSNGGTIAFAGSGTVSGTVTFNNVTLAGGVNFGSASTIGANGSLQLNSNGFVTTNAPTYNSTSTLIYNNTGTYGRGIEWSATSGTGYPGNVQVSNNTTINYPNTGSSSFSTDLAIAGNLTVDAGSSLYMDFGGSSNKSGRLSVNGNVILNGNLSLGNAAGGDIKVGGNWTRNVGGVFTSNARAIFFTGAGTNELSADGGESVGYLVLEKTGGSVKLLSNLTITADNAGTAMSLTSTASFDLNGNTLSLNGSNQSIILADGGAVNFIGAANSTIAISNAIKTVSTSNGGTVVFGDNVLISASTGINFGSGLSTVNGTFRINGGGFVQSNAPVYGPTSTLQYNTTGTYGRFLEWSANSGAGYPANVQLSNNTTLNYPNTGSGAFSTNLSIAGNLTIDNGSALYLGFGDNGNKSGALTVAGNVTVNGPLGLGNATGGNLLIGGNWTRAAASADFFPNGRQLIFNGTGDQSISRTGGETFSNNIVVNKASGVLTANNTITFNDDLTLTSGTINDGGNTLTVNGNIVNTGTHASTGSGKLVMNGTSKTISGATLGNVEIASSSISLSGNPTINGILTLTNSLNLASSSRTLTIATSGVVEAGTQQLTGTGTVNMNGIFQTARTEGFSGTNASIPAATVSLGNASTVEYTSSSAQSVSARSDYHNLTLVGNAVKSLLGNTTSSGIVSLITGSDILSLGSNTLTLNGTVTGSGLLRGGTTSNVTIGGTGSLGTLNFDQTTDGTTNILNNVELNRSSGTLALGNKLVIANVYTPTSGVLTTNNHLHLRSTSSNTARIAAGSSSGGYVSGDVTVERYMSASSNRAWRLLTPGVSTSTNINANWQEGKVNTVINTNVPADVAGYGVHITGAGGNSNGFDVTQTNAASLYSFNQATQNWALITNTNVNTLDAKQGYLLFVRGNRDNITPINTATGSSNVTLRARGTLLQGTQTFSNLATANNFSLVTNPFASPIDWTTIYALANNATNFNGSVNIWDPNVGTRGGFVAINDIGIPSNGASLLTEHLQSGQAFFIQTKTGVVGNPSFVIEEAHKSNTNNLDVFRTNTSLEKLKIQLRFTASNIQRIADGVVAIFSNTYSNGIDGRDAEQIANWDEDIALTRNGKELSIESRNTITANDTLFLKIGNLRAAQANYRWVIEPEQLNAAGLTAFLEDNFTNTSTPISLTAATTINFTVSSNAASTAANRFRIVFRNNAALPVTITQIKAQQKGNDVQVLWNTVNEQNIQHYEVEKSTNAQQFSKIATVAAKTASSSNDYSMVDASIPSGTYYYRLKIVEKNGSYNYSKVVRFTIGKGNINTVSIYPNPIKGNTINLQLNNVEKGNYTIKVLNYAGQVVYQSSLQHLGGSATEQLVLSKALASGQYQLEMSNEKGMKMVQTIMKE
jgi:hypothetical protein